MQISDLLSPSNVKVPLLSTDKNAAIAELIDTLTNAGLVANRHKALECVMERERTRTTGIGSGVAIPHGKTNAVGKVCMAIGCAAKPIDFKSIDAKPVSIVIMILCPQERVSDHVQALARVSRLMSIDSLRSKLASAKNPDEFYQYLLEAEKEL